MKHKIPCIVGLPHSRTNVVGCDFKGNDSITTAGGIFLNSDLLMSNCKFSSFRAGALLLSSTRNNHIKVADSEISRCGFVGVYAQGGEAKPLLTRLKIDNIEGPGVRVHKANRAKIVGCEIVKCQMGVEVVCAEPIIAMNVIKQNYENGVVTYAKNGLCCNAIIKHNEIAKNKDNGVLCAGTRNFTRVTKNTNICSNRRAGVKALEGAAISITRNKISSNFGQGVLLVEGTSAHIELNEIFTNYKANIAYGGENTADTVVLNNKIHSSRSEGIFVIESGFSWIYRNEVYGNNDGVILFDASPHLCGNVVRDNQRAGVIVSGSSFPKMERNEVAFNNTSGVLARDNSRLTMENNHLHDNYYQLSLRQGREDKLQRLMENNNIEGTNELPKSLCSTLFPWGKSY